MTTSSRTPQEHSGDWRFAARVPASARRLSVHPDGMDTVLLVADEEGDWWAVPGTCRACGDSLDPTTNEVLRPANVIHCHACGAPHGPGIRKGGQVATLVVDDEIYLLATSQDTEHE